MSGTKRGRGRPRQIEPSDAFIARQAEIIDIAVEVFRQHGFDQGTLDDVAATLGTGRASLYHYVGSKPHLLYLIFDRAITTTLARMDELTQIADPAERLRALMRHQVEIIVDNPAMFAVFFGDRPALDDKYEAEIRLKERQLLRNLIQALAAADDAGVVAIDDPRLAAQAILGMTSWIYKWFDPDRDNPDDFIRTCEQLLFRR
ncbi:MAG: TetR/AcrR family transcriptional regulator [Acidimicrobiales bacterium]